jgi:hypothetical protein
MTRMEWHCSRSRDRLPLTLSVSTHRHCYTVHIKQTVNTHSIVQYSTHTQYSTAQHSTAQHSIAQHSTAHTPCHTAQCIWRVLLAQFLTSCLSTRSIPFVPHFVMLPMSINPLFLSLSPVLSYRVHILLTMSLHFSHPFIPHTSNTVHLLFTMP